MENNRDKPFFFLRKKRTIALDLMEFIALGKKCFLDQVESLDLFIDSNDDENLN